MSYQIELSLVDTECGQSLATNALKRLINQSEQRILQIDQSKMLQSICSV